MGRLTQVPEAGRTSAFAFFHVPPMPAIADVDQLVAKILGELRPDGNGDWDGDGIPNNLDDDPFSYGNPCNPMNNN